MISEKMETAINKQINEEMFSAYLYLSMSAYFKSIDLTGAAIWMKAQAQEEMLHAMKFYNFIFERGGKVKLLAIDQPQTEWDTPISAFNDALNHERKISSLIHQLVDLAMSEKDHASIPLLQWFVSEQVEEEDSVSKIINKLKMAGDNPGVLYMIDNELGQRVFTFPTATAE